jgi:hypothetical protein
MHVRLADTRMAWQVDAEVPFGLAEAIAPAMD